MTRSEALKTASFNAINQNAIYVMFWDHLQEVWGVTHYDHYRNLGPMVAHPEKTRFLLPGGEICTLECAPEALRTKGTFYTV